LTKADLISELVIASNNKLDKMEADDCITTLLNKMVYSLLNGDVIKLHNIGSLQLFQGAQRLCRNVVRGEPILVPAKTRVRFITSSVLRKRLARLDERKNEPM
jgi:nucleoid DNA-binding protein